MSEWFIYIPALYVMSFKAPKEYQRIGKQLET